MDFERDIGSGIGVVIELVIGALIVGTVVGAMTVGTAAYTIGNTILGAVVTTVTSYAAPLLAVGVALLIWGLYNFFRKES